MKATLNVTIIIKQEYEVGSQFYNGCKSVEKMIEIDTRNFHDDPELFISSMLDAGAEVEIVITGEEK